MHSPERICEALAWLYGVEFKARQGLKMLGFHTEYMPSSDIFSNQRVTFLHRNDETFCACWPYNRREDITDRIEHALSVTAPWEWMYDRADMPKGNGYAVLTYVAEHAIWFWYVKDPSGTDFEGPDIEGHGKTEDEAKALARTAYLTWMRGCLALRGLEK